MQQVSFHYKEIHVYFQFSVTNSIPIPAAAQCKARACGLSIAGMAGSYPLGARMSISCVCFVLLGRDFCVVLITSPERRPKD